MLVIKDKRLCSGCTACEQACPKKCIEMVADNEGFLYPKISLEDCIDCGLCEKICPINNRKPTKNEQTEAYAVINNDGEARLCSSSGGVFSLLAKSTIEKNGLVFGVGYGKELTVEHKRAQHGGELFEIRGSKYVQSQLNDSFKNAKEALEQGKLVLFTGTPCQIEGLYAFIGKDYENLITQDIVCHGVSSPLVWKNYLHEQQKKFASNPIKASFRDKRKGWSKFSMSLSFENGKTYSKTLDKDAMLQAFLNNLCLRPSCYDCKFKQKVHKSDITLADFWGIEKINPKLNDDKGISLVLINSWKGKRLFDEISNGAMFEKVDCDKAIKYNSAVLSSVATPKERQAYMQVAIKGDVKRAYKKFCRAPLLRRLGQSVHKFLYKCKSKLLRR